MNLDQALQTFIEESCELLAAMEDALLTLEANPGDTDAINAVFRAMHTIKGSAGLFGLTHIVAFTHVAESLLDRVRNGELQVDESLMVLMLGSRDHIGNLIDRLAAGDTEPDADMQSTGGTLVAGMNERLGIAPRSVAKYQAKPPLESEATLIQEGGGLVESDTWHISVRFAQDLFRNGFDPLSFVRYLGTLGQLVHVETITSGLPAGRADGSGVLLPGFRNQFGRAGRQVRHRGGVRFRA